MRRMLAKVGIVTDSLQKTKPVHNEFEVAEVLTAAMEIYDSCCSDPITAPAAYGIAVGALSLALGISLQTAVLIFEHSMKKHEILTVLKLPALEDQENDEG